MVERIFQNHLERMTIPCHRKGSVKLGHADRYDFQQGGIGFKAFQFNNFRA